MIAFRVDVNKNIASGHIMRCLTIAKKIREAGEKVLFFSGSDDCTAFLEPQGFEFVVTESRTDNWDEEIPLMKTLIKKYDIQCLFVDSYIVSPLYLSELNKVCKVAYIDDYLKERLSISLLLAPTQSRSLDKVGKMYEGTDTRLLLGKDYLIIRDEFLTKDVFDEYEKGIFVSTGGTDNYHFSLKFVEKVIQNKKLSKEKFFVILGSLNDDEQKIKEIVEGLDNFEVKKNINNIAMYMKRSKYAIAAGGNTLYELLCCKIPSSCIALSDDQVPLGERLAGKNIVTYEGDCRENVDAVIANCVETVERFLEHGIDEKMSPAVDSFTDGLGAVRIAKALIELSE